MQRSNLFIVAACAALTLASLPAAAQPVYQSATSLVGWPGRGFSTPGAAAVAAGDLDGDGVVDLVFVSPNDQRTAILKGTGGGNFAAPRYHMMGSGSDQVALADIDRNGSPDFILSSSRETGIRVIYTFSDGHAIGYNVSTSSKVGSLAVADLDGDGYLDLIATAVDSPSVMVLTQVPNMTDFRESVEPTQALPKRFILADMNGDGHVDLLIGTAQGFEIHYKGLLADGVPAHAIVSIAAGLDDIASGDFNKDGIADVIGLQKAAGRVLTIQGRSGLPSFAVAGPSGYPAFSTGPSPAGLTVSDLEGDGWLDAVVVNEFTPIPGFPGQIGLPGTTLRVLSGGSVLDHGVETFTLTLSNGYTTGPQPHAVLLADVNGDTLPDLVTANLGGVGHDAPQSDVSVFFRQVTAADLLRVISSLTTLQQQNVALAAQAQSDREQALAMAAQLYGAQAQNLTLSTQNGELQAQVAALTGQVTSLTEDKTNLTAQAAQLTTERDTARAALAPLTAEVEALTAATKISNAQIASLQEANTSLTEDKANLTAQAAQLTSERDTARAALAPLRAEVEALTAATKITNAQIASLQEANAQLGEGNAALQAALTAANASLAAANASLAAANANLATVTASLAAANQTVAVRGQQIAALNQQVSTLAAQVASLTAALAQATDGIAEGLAAIEQDMQRTFRNPRFQLPGDTLEEQLDAVAGALQDLNRGAKQDLYRDFGWPSSPAPRASSPLKNGCLS